MTEHLDGPALLGSPWEARFERRLKAHAASLAVAVDAPGVARAVAVAARPRPSGLSMLALAASMAALLGLLWLAAVGAPDLKPLMADRPIVFATRLGGLYLADRNGREHLQIAADGRYADPRWSLSGAAIAVVRGRPPSLLELPDEELVILDPDGRPRARVAGPIVSFGWLGRISGEDALAAIIGPRRNIKIVTASGRSLVEIDGAAFPELPTDISTWPPVGAGDPGVLVSAGRSLVGVDNLATGPPRHLELVPAEKRWIRAAAVSPDGGTLAFVASPCPSDCAGEVRIRAVSGGAERTLATKVLGDIRPSWSADGQAVLAWPQLVPIDGSSPTTMNRDARIRELDVGAWWTRTAPDGVGVWFFRRFPGLDDRRWELYRIPAENAAPRRLLQDITGADQRP